MQHLRAALHTVVFVPHELPRSDTDTLGQDGVERDHRGDDDQPRCKREGHLQQHGVGKILCWGGGGAV